jgi:DNA-binding transcriptional MerR regulator/methylmalonyl-CoA mutase cobalamin-binding subunit
VSRATGLSPDTLRAWQKRYGFPVPQRKPSGHRLYSSADVRRLRRISEAIARGHRPGNLVRLSEHGLQSLLASSRRPDPRAASAELSRPLRPLMPLVQAHDGRRLAAALLADAAALGPLEFLRRRVAPLVEEVGEAWARGAIGVHHEHLFSERIEDVLRSVRLPLERAGHQAFGRAASRPAVLLATLPGETHALGLQMAALAVAASGGAPVVLGADTPVADIAAAARARRCAAVAISISISTGGPGSRDLLASLRAALPAGVLLFVGGLGARRSHPPGGCVILEDFDALAAWMRRLD